MHFDDQSKQIVFIFMSWNVLKEIENMFSMFLSSYRKNRESLGELDKAVKHLPAARVPTVPGTFRSPKLPLVFL